MFNGLKGRLPVGTSAILDGAADLDNAQGAGWRILGGVMAVDVKVLKLLK